MSSWLAGAIAWVVGLAFGPARNAIRGLGDIIRSTFAWLNLSIGELRRFATGIHRTALAVGRSLNRFASEVWADFQHIYHTFVPAWFRNAVNTAKRWAEGAIADAIRFLLGLIGTFERWARSAINGLRSFIDGVSDWLWGWIRFLQDRINGLLGALRHVLSGASALASWLIGALLSELWKYVQRNETTIFRWMRDRSIAFTLWSANRLERIIARLL